MEGHTRVIEMGRKQKEMIGEVYGLLRVLEEYECSVPKNKKYYTRCINCGKIKVMLGGNIRRIKKENGGCECIPFERKGVFKQTHGLSGTSEFKIWTGMLSRCYNDKHVHYHNYGGRGIDVCDKWRNGPEDFIGWLRENGWKKGLTIDRKDNDRGYCPDNCRIATKIENANNRRNNRLICVRGKIYTISEASRSFFLRKTTIRERLERGWADADAVSPVI